MKSHQRPFLWLARPGCDMKWSMQLRDFLVSLVETEHKAKRRVDWYVSHCGGRPNSPATATGALSSASSTLAPAPVAATHQGRARRERGTRPRARAHSMMERNARFYVERATLAGRSATAIMQGDPPPGRCRHCYLAGRPTAWAQPPLLSCRATHRPGAAATAIMQGDPPSGAQPHRLQADRGVDGAARTINPLFSGLIIGHIWPEARPCVISGG